MFVVHHQRNDSLELTRQQQEISLPFFLLCAENSVDIRYISYYVLMCVCGTVTRFRFDEVHERFV